MPGTPPRTWTWGRWSWTATSSTGRFDVSQAIGTLVIRGDIVGAGNDSGQITCANLGSATIGGSIFGGVGDRSGAIFTIRLGTISITGDLVGGVGQEAGIL